MSTNISKAKREELLKQVAEIRNKLMEHQDENTNQLLVYLSNIEKDINGKKYGLVFEEHREAVDELLESNVPVLVEDESLKIDNGGTQNFLIEGDNLASLKLLEKTHKGKIDFIYIDPPYNRGKTDFIYDDDFVIKEDTFRHSKWCSFMKNRLELAKKLLSKKGLLFISIDDNEVAALKILCDEILGAENFINLFVWQRNSSAKTEKGKFTVNTEYVLLYAKTSSYSLNPAYKPLSEASQKLFKFDDNDGRGKYQTVSLQKPRDPGPETTYDYIDNTGKVWPCPPKGWRMKYEKIKALENDNRLVLTGNSLRVKDYWNERENEGKRVDTLWNDLPQNTAGSGELEIIMGRPNSFDNPKPTDLIKRCLEISNKNAICLDFFAGSGTTGHAVMKLNAEDGGKRKFILCTNNENNICRDVTYERIKRVIEKEDYKASLKYYKVDFVPITEQVYYEYADKLLLHIKELVELENGLDFDGNKKVAICLSDEDLQDFVNSLGDTTTYKSVYVGHDVFVTPEIESKLNTLGIKINIIPDYYYGELRG
ncbi:MAG TPA: site-specific DNA-methyltransferase [Clostridiales bacterium]|nr:site-specific DNA-methyltransferase [Clostridiales bacterium]